MLRRALRHKICGIPCGSLLRKQRMCQMAASITERTKTSAGVTLVENGARFRVWAPERKTVRVVLVDASGAEQRSVELDGKHDGYFEAFTEDVKPGDLYWYHLDDDPQKYPDPASHFQPQ